MGNQAHLVSYYSGGLCDSRVLAAQLFSLTLLHVFCPSGTWKLQFDHVAAHALLCAAWRCPEALDLASKIVEERYWKGAILLAEIPGRIPTTQHLGSIMNLVFYDAASKRRKSTFSDLYFMKNTAPERFSTSIATQSTFRTLCNRSYEAPPTPVLLNKFNEVRITCFYGLAGA